MRTARSAHRRCVAWSMLSLSYLLQHAMDEDLEDIRVAISLSLDQGIPP